MVTLKEDKYSSHLREDAKVHTHTVQACNQTATLPVVPP